MFQLILNLIFQLGHSQGERGILKQPRRALIPVEMYLATVAFEYTLISCVELSRSPA